MGMAQEQNRRGWTVPPAYPEYCRACRELAEQVGEQRILTLGETVLGKPILGFWFGSPCQPTLYVGGVHAQEWLTTLVLFRFGWELEEHSRVHGKLCGVDVCRALEGRGLLTRDLVWDRFGIVGAGRGRGMERASVPGSAAGICPLGRPISGEWT